MRALLYVRISELTDATTAPERQRKEGRLWVERQGGEVVDVIEDLDISGYHTGIDRPGLAEALSRIEAGEADTLVIYKIDRLARSIVTFHQVLDRVESVGGRLVSVSEALDFGTPAGRLVASVLASFAEFESQTISSRVKAAQRHLGEVGKWRGGRRPYGWRPEEAPDGKGLVLVPEEAEAEILREIVERALSGEALTAVAGDLNDRNVPTANEKPWRRQTLGQVLKNQRLRGIVGDPAWIELQKVLGQRTPVMKNATHKRRLLTNLIECGACGARMYEGSRGNYRTYYCRSGAPGEGYCSVAASADRVDETVEEKFLKVVGTMPIETGQGELVDDHAEQRASLAASIDDLETDRYIHRLFTTEEELDRYREIYARLTTELSELPEPRRIETGLTAPTGATYAEMWAELDDEQKAKWLEQALERVVIRRSKTPSPGRSWDSDRVEIFFG